MKEKFKETLEEAGIKIKKDNFLKKEAYVFEDNRNIFVISFGNSDVGLILDQGEVILSCDDGFRKLKKQKKKSLKTVKKIISKPKHDEIILNYNSILDLDDFKFSLSIKKHIENNLERLDDKTIMSIFYIYDNFGFENLKKLDKEIIKKYIKSYFGWDNLSLDKILKEIENIEMIKTDDKLDEKYNYVISNDLYENRYPIDHDILASLFDRVGYLDVKIYYNQKLKITPEETEIYITKIIEEKKDEITYFQL